MAKNVIDYRQIEDEFTCGICQNVYEEPYRPEGCRHVFCKNCLFNSSTNSNSCPCCRKKFDFNRIVFEHQIRNQINSLKYNCETCLKTNKLSDYNYHSQTCYQVTTPKPFSNTQTSRMSSTKSSNSLASISSATSVASGSSIRTVNRQTFKCPYCTQSNLTFDGLRGHCNQQHPLGKKDVVCPICASMPWGDQNQKSIDFIGHLNLRHKFEYDNYVDFGISEEEMMNRAISDSLNAKMSQMRIKTR